jgi:hypothetical protein
VWVGWCRRSLVRGATLNNGKTIDRPGLLPSDRFMTGSAAALIPIGDFDVRPGALAAPRSHCRAPHCVSRNEIESPGNQLTRRS